MMDGKATDLTEALFAYLRESGLEQPVLEVQVEEIWPKVMGSLVASMTRSVEVKDGMLIVKVNSAALKAQLFENRFELVKKLNEAVGANVIRDCRILG